MELSGIYALIIVVGLHAVTASNRRVKYEHVWLCNAAQQLPFMKNIFTACAVLLYKATIQKCVTVREVTASA